MKRVCKYILLIGLLVFLGLFYAQKTNLTTADLGRHIKNGQSILETHKPLITNFYSYTQPDHFSVNHHWLSGVAFYLVHKAFDFSGLSIFYILLNLATLFFFFKTAQNKTNFGYAFFLSILAIPLITNRLEIRPEVFSYLFLGVYFYLFSRFKAGRLPFKLLFILLPLQVFWVNLHIFFIVGPFLAGVFFLEALINKRSQAKQYLILLGSLMIVSLVNPYGIKGVLTPLTILNEYGYMIAENQSVIFMQRRFKSFVYLWFQIIFGLSFLSFIPLIFKKQLKKHTVEIILFVCFSLLAWRAVRGIPIFGLFFIPIVAGNVYSCFDGLSRNLRKIFNYSCGLIVLALLITGFLLKKAYYPFKPFSGIGLMPGIQNSSFFFKQTGIQGPIFNNYDIGGYLIYNFFPQERVFVDNRPESYSVSFFKETYVPMQEKEELWEEMDKKYGFNVIYFYRHDFTPWAQPFLIERIKDLAWAPVFVDNYVLILLKRNAKNNRLIRAYELPPSTFRYTK